MFGHGKTALTSIASAVYQTGQQLPKEDILLSSCKATLNVCGSAASTTETVALQVDELKTSIVATSGPVQIADTWTVTAC